MPQDIPPNSGMIVECKHNGLRWDDWTTLMVEGSNPPGGLLVTPAVYQQALIRETVPVHIINMTHKVITLPANTYICQAFPVSVTPPVDFDDVIPSRDIQSMFPLEHLSPDLRHKVHQCLERHKKAFSWHEWDLGHFEGHQHRIKVTDDSSFRHKYRRIPPAMVSEVRDHLQKMIDAGIIRSSNSPYSSPAVFVRKPDNSLRFCCDFRTLNSRTVKDNHYIPIIEEAFDRLAGSKWFSTLDLKAGYWQMDMHPDDIKYTGFSAGCLGFYEWIRLPMGLKNSGSSFQRMIEAVMGSLNLKICLLYLDDVILFSEDEKTHLQRLDLVLTKIEEAGLKLKPSKCCLFQNQVKYLGHMVSEDGIQADLSKINKVLDWPIPTNRKQLQRFLGFTGYYRRFVKDYARIAGPLHEMLKGEGGRKSGKAKQKSGKSKDNQPFVWGPSQQDSFSRLIQALTTTPVLSFADFSKPFVVQVDASFEGLGAVICQEHEGMMKPIAYASRKLSSSEKRYPVHKLEFLALKWAVCDKFHEYLYASEFEVWTDNNPLTYVMKSAKLDATGLRWVAELSLYNFSIKYTPGKSNAAADALSRLEEDCVLSDESVKAICSGTAVEELISTVSLSSQVIPECPATSMWQNEVITDDWARLQAEDKTIGPVLQALSNSQPLDGSAEGARKLWCQRRRLVIDADVLYRTCQTTSGVIKQLILPECKKSEVLRLLHDEMGHFGRDRVLHLARSRFYWPGMLNDITNYVTQCENCLKRKGKNPIAELGHLTSTHPMELVCMDFLGLETSSGGYNSILVLTDHFTRYAMAVPTRNQSARTTAKALIDLFVNHYGLPQRLHSDRGAQFVGKVISELCKMLGIKRSTTTPFHPMGNGNCEHLNQVLLSMLGTLPESKKSRWKEFVQPLVHAYNCTKCEVTGYTPFELMFGRTPRLPIDHQFGLLNEEEEVSYNEYVDDLRKKLENSYELAKKTMDRAQTKSKGRYDRKVRGNNLEEGDRVLVRKTKFQEGKHKLANRWDDTVYIVEKKLDGIPVFELRPEGGKGRHRRLHRNNILPISPKGKQKIESESSESSSEEIPPLPTEESKNEEMSEEQEEQNEVNEDSSDEESSTEQGEVDKVADKKKAKEVSVGPRRSTRERRPPARFTSGDYVMNFQGTKVDDQKFVLISKMLDLLK
jgi:transposase InsO family protein